MLCHVGRTSTPWLLETFAKESSQIPLQLSCAFNQEFQPALMPAVVQFWLLMSAKSSDSKNTTKAAEPAGVRVSMALQLGLKERLSILAEVGVSNSTRKSTNKTREILLHFLKIRARVKYQI